MLALVAEDRSNAAIAPALRRGPRAIEKHISSIFQKLDLPPSDAENRRVRAFLEYLKA